MGTVVLANHFLRGHFFFFFCNPEKFVFGVCNGCQFLSELAPLMPGKKRIGPSFQVIFQDALKLASH